MPAAQASVAVRSRRRGTGTFVMSVMQLRCVRTGSRFRSAGNDAGTALLAAGREAGRRDTYRSVAALLHLVYGRVRV